MKNYPIDREFRWVGWVLSTPACIKLLNINMLYNILVHDTVEKLHTAACVKNKTNNNKHFNDDNLPASQYAITKRSEI